MEISNKWRNLLCNQGFHGLPAHSQTALIKALGDDPDAFFQELFDKQCAVIIQNYGFPEEMTRDSVDMRVYFNQHYLHEIGYAHSTDSSSAFGFMAEFVTHIRYQTRHYNYDHGLSDKLNAVFSLSVLLSKIDEAKGTGNEGMVSRIKDFKSKDKNGMYRSTRARFARAFNQQFPGFPEAVVDGMHDIWKDSYGTIDESKFHIHVGRTTKHFLAAYENENLPSPSNIETTIFTKHLCNSCMQYDRYDEDGWEEYARDSDMHCVEAYATTDEDFDGLKSDRYFEVMFMTDKEDPFDTGAQVYARTVFSRKKNGFPEFGPLYVTSNITKEIMLRNVPKLVDHLSEDDQAKFADEFRDFLARTDNKNCYNYPNVWDGAIFKAFNEYGDALSKKEVLLKATDRSIPVISPYLDIGLKQAEPVFNEKNGNVYFSVFNKQAHEHKNFDNDIEMIINDDMGVLPTTFCGHQGINFFQRIVLKKTCSHCEKKTFNMRRRRNICDECHNQFYVQCSFTGENVLREEARTINFLHYQTPSNLRFQNSAICVMNDRDYTLNRTQNFPIIYNNWDFERMETVVSPRLEITVLDVQDRRRIMHTDVAVLTDSLVDIGGQQYFKYDNRICWDVLNDEFVIHDDSQVVFTRYRQEAVRFKVVPEFIDILKKTAITEEVVNHNQHGWIVNSDHLIRAFARCKTLRNEPELALETATETP